MKKKRLIKKKAKETIVEVGMRYRRGVGTGHHPDAKKNEDGDRQREGNHFDQGACVRVSQPNLKNRGIREEHSAVVWGEGAGYRQSQKERWGGSKT
jgi:hypothetical protein